MDGYSNLLNYCSGTPIIIDHDKVIKTQKRRHKKKRINKKWLKRYGYDITIQKSSLEDGQVISTLQGLMMNEKTYHMLEINLWARGGNKNDRE